MNRRTWRVGLLGVGLALVGVWGAWVPHRAAALVLSGWDLAEFVKFVPGALVPRELFYLPVWCAGAVLALLASRRITVLSLHRLVLLGIALALMVSILPPYPDVFKAYQSPEFRWQFIFGLGGGVAVTASMFSGRWPAWLVGGLIVTLALLGAIPALWQFLQVRDEIGAVYDAPLGWGWGLGIFLVGWGLVTAVGAQLLIRKPV